MIKFDRNTNFPHEVDEAFWVELSKIDTSGVENPILAFVMSFDGTYPIVINKVELRDPDETPNITLYGTGFKWGWESEDVLPFWDMNDHSAFQLWKVCGPEFLDRHKFAGDTRYAYMPESIKNRIVFNRDVKKYVRDKMVEAIEGICDGLWTMRGNVEMEVNAYEIMRSDPVVKYLLLEDNRYLDSLADDLAEIIGYNMLPQDWSLYDLVFDAGRMLDNDGSVSCYPDDGDGLELHDITLDDFNKVQRSLALNTLDDVMQYVRETCVEWFQHDPHFQEPCKTVDDLRKIG